MLLYRVFPYLPTASKGQPGHPLHVHPAQGKGRWDNPGSYLAWYMAFEVAGAVGETFADISTWRDEMFEFPALPGSRKALGFYELPDDLPYVDLDDAATLVELAMRPTQVIVRNRPYTQAKALSIYQQKKWSGIRWWSFHRPQWRVICLWDIDPKCDHVEDLDTSHIAVSDAGRTLSKPIVAL